MPSRRGRSKNDEPVPRVRLAGIVRELLARGRTTRAELERRFEVTERQMRQDLRALTDAQLVRIVDDGTPHRAYEVSPDLLVRGLPDPDQLAWVVGRQVTRFLAGTALYDEGPEPSLEQVVRYVAEPSRTYEPRGPLVADLLAAARGSLRVSLTYDAAQGERTFPGFEPTNLLVYKRALYVVGHFDGSAKAYAYAVDRVRSVALGDPFPRRADWDVDAWLRDRFGLTSDPEHDDPQEVVLRFAADRAMYVRERTFHPSQRLEALRDGQVRLTMWVTGKELLPFVLQWGPKVVVEAPEWLREAVAAELEAALAAYRR
ncbi:MAG: WYL domain-containing protein [Myxococcota bacterium]